MALFRPHTCASPHKQVVLISLKQASLQAE